jgi:Protein of unknown function (DUF3224)
MNPRPRRPLVLGLAAPLVLTAGVMYAHSAAAEPSSDSSGLHKVFWQYTQPPPVVSPPVCDATGNCVGSYAIVTTDPGSGDVAGTSVLVGTGVRLPDGSLYGNSTIKFTGTINGCGSGSLAMRSTGFNRDGVTSGEIVIVPGSGTGDLVGIEGSGVVVNGTADGTGGAGGVEMRIRCPGA